MNQSYKHLYQRFLGEMKGLHFAAHSHHFWPDVSREGHMKAWDDAARFNDKKWEHVFTHVTPQVRKHIASILELQHPDQIALASSTHDLVIKIFSNILLKPKAKVFTTDSEFYSFERQLKRWKEVHPGLQVQSVKTAGLLSDRSNWLQETKKQIQAGHPDIIFMSQVFFNSGLALSMDDFAFIFEGVPSETIIVIDGYHAFAAIPTSLKKLEGRVFYLAGGYKYAQGGEGACFAVVPKGSWRPVITGWLSEFSDLSKARQGEVAFSQDGMAFWGSTLDPSGWYRFISVWDQFQALKLDVHGIHRHVQRLQQTFMSDLPPQGLLSPLKPLFKDLTSHGHFLTFEALDVDSATSIRMKLSERGVYIDQRGARLRFGFGLYQDHADVAELMTKVK